MLGAAVSLGDGSALVVGGAADLGFTATNAVHRITEGVGPSGGFGQKDAAFTLTFPVPVLFPAAATTPDGDAVFVGGAVIRLSTPGITLSDEIVLYNSES